ncbi:M10 family metallopeptidase C-terminal domain-containing protein [Chroococcus sp. FPU101]|uniref:M10 family metallopeptidase C-terminal domain-containing protein n=1 Tax=Chroococcus sp. FPU101 TaxID=1974212 RepID=UPI001A8E5EA9|nr:matrixin family metalloprotease [Chroococcus sp. FPU101]GFE69272.1 serralysin [Chroococcus sp. FPU101]
MSTFVGAVTNVSSTGLTYINGLLWGSRWRVENDSRRLTYSFINDQTWDTNLYPAEETAFHNAIQSWANVANFRLEFTGNNDHAAEITFHSVTAATIGGSLGLAMPPGEIDLPYVQGDVMINYQAYSTNPTSELLVGSYDYLTYVHEIGHALGLAHPHDNGGRSTIFPGVDGSPFTDTGNYGLNQYVWTVMSYIDINSSYSPGYDTNWGYIGGPMAFDIATIQYLYGVNTTYNTGNNTYYLPTTNGVGTYWTCIWDAGGSDTISGQFATNSVTINLNNASIANNDPNAGGYINRVNGISGGYTIANSQGGRCIIENAVGGSYGDSITGNSYNNSLSGNGGNDTIYGGFGADALYGGSGNDNLDSGTVSAYDTANEFLDGGAGNDYLLAGNGNDSLYGGAGLDTLNGYNGNDYLDGGTENDYLLGSGGNDTIYGGFGADLLYGGDGNDYLDSGTVSAYDTANEFLDGGAGNDYLLAGNGNDSLYGGAGLDTLNGVGGNDILVGGLNTDSLTGGSGNDRFVFDTGAIFNAGTIGIDIITDFVRGFDKLVLDKTTFTSLGSLSFTSVASFALAQTSSALITYIQSTGSLFYNQNGLGAGFGTGSQFADLTNGLTLTATDFLLQA